MNSGKLFVACRRSIAALPPIAVDEVVPVGDQVAERTALVAERDAAVHAARALLAQLVRPGTAGRPRSSRARAPRPAASACFVRWISMNRSALPMWTTSDQRRRTPARVLRSGARASACQHALVVARHHLHERAAGRPVRRAAPRRARCPCSARGRSSIISTSSMSSVVLERLEIDHLAVAAPREAPVGVEHVGDAAAHARREVAAGPAEHDAPARRSCTRSRDRRRLRRRRCAPLLRTANRSPATPRKYASPLVAP